MYFLTGLSYRGAKVVLVWDRRESSDPVDHYVVQYCWEGGHKSSHKLSIQDVMDLALRTILFCITRVEGNIGPRLVIRA